MPEIISITDMQTTVSLKWTLLTKDVTEYFIECSSVNQVSNLVVDNETSIANMRGLLPSSDYRCCISAVFNNHRTQSCAFVRTGVLDQGTAGDVGAIGGVLGFIVAMLLLLLLLAVLALLYPCLIRPRVQRSRVLSR